MPDRDGVCLPGEPTLREVLADIDRATEGATYASREEMLEALLDAEIMARSRPGMTAAQLHDALPLEVRATYWRRKVAEWAEVNGYDPDTA